MKRLYASGTRLRVAGLGLFLGLAAGATEATIDVQEGDSSPGSAVNVVQGVVSNTVQFMERLGLPLDPVEAREQVRESLLKVADPGARFLGKEDTRVLEELSEGSFQDTGIRIALTNGIPVVSQVVEGSPAEEAGVEAGWMLDKVNGRSTAAQHLPGLRRTLCDHTAGEVELTFVEKDDEPRTITLEKRAGKPASVEQRERMPLGLCYMKVNALTEGTGREISDTLLTWAEEDAFGAVLDLRGACGSDVDAAAEVVNLLAKSGEKLFSFQDASGGDAMSYDARPGKTLGMPLMILVDEETTGASEVLAAALSGSGRGAMLLGAPTMGDPMIRERVELDDGEWIYIATRRLTTNGGKTFAGRGGVEPDVRVVMRDRSYRDYEPPPPLLTDRRETTDEEKETLELRQRTRGDVPLTRAVDVLLGLKALNIHGFGFESPSAR